MVVAKYVGSIDRANNAVEVDVPRAFGDAFGGARWVKSGAVACGSYLAQAQTREMA
jgi:hypothetical protein